MMGFVEARLNLALNCRSGFQTGGLLRKHFLRVAMGHSPTKYMVHDEFDISEAFYEAGLEKKSSC